jgi:AraC-like DNA-binding protein
MAHVLELDEVDVLADVLDSARLRGRVFCRGEFSAPWCLGFAATNASHFHVIERGHCWLQFNGTADSVRLEEGDLLLVMRRKAYQLSDDPATPPVPLTDLVADGKGGAHAVLKLGGGGRETDFICGAFEFRDESAASLFSVLPEWIRVDTSAEMAGEWLDSAVKLLRAETRRLDAGTASIVARLTDIIFVQAVRAWLQNQPDGAAGWLGALKDPTIGAALRLIHKTPERQWTVSDLAGELGMSRSPFATRFTALVGTPPMSYVTRWRMQTAAGLLVAQALGVKEVAERVGYESTAAFSRGFRKQFGVSPGAFRKGSRSGH